MAEVIPGNTLTNPPGIDNIKPGVPVKMLRTTCADATLLNDIPPPPDAPFFGLPLLSDKRDTYVAAFLSRTIVVKNDNFALKGRPPFLSMNRSVCPWNENTSIDFDLEVTFDEAISPTNHSTSVRTDRLQWNAGTVKDDEVTADPVPRDPPFDLSTGPFRASYTISKEEDDNCQGDIVFTARLESETPSEYTSLDGDDVNRGPDFENCVQWSEGNITVIFSWVTRFFGDPPDMPIGIVKSLTLKFTGVPPP